MVVMVVTLCNENKEYDLIIQCPVLQVNSPYCTLAVNIQKKGGKKMQCVTILFYF